MAALLALPCTLLGCDDDPERFELRIENVAGASLDTPLAPGVFVLHDEANPLFVAGQPDPGQGLEALAEDGDPAALAANLDTAHSGVFDTPSGMTTPGPLAPGEAYVVEIEALPDRPNLSFATMVVESNDVFLAPAGAGIPLFDDEGDPLPLRDVTDMVQLWNAGTEIDQAPGLGPLQAPRQPAPDSGPPEGVVRQFAAGTRTLPLARDLVDVNVSEAGGTFIIEIVNVSEMRGLLVTPISPVFVAVHDETFELFDPGSTASMELEALAEDGDPSQLVDTVVGRDGTLLVRAMSARVGVTGAGPAAPGERFELMVTPDAEHPFLTLASMVVETNDVFLAFPPTGMRLLDESGAPRDPAELEAAIERSLALWDAGTEANEVPGVGMSQAPRQGAPDTGPADPNQAVRIYDDTTNDLAGERAGGFADVDITRLSGTMFQVRVTNTSGGTAYPGVMTPVAHAVHDASVSLFQTLEPASDSLESLAEDGDAAALVAQLSMANGVASAGLADTPDAGGVGPLAPGASYTFTVSADATHRWLSLASMVVPSNDTFIAFEPSGIELVDANGAPRSDAAIAADVTAMLAAWDAGTEANQAGAGGRDQAPRQAGPNTGAAEGDGTVRAEADPVWSYPAVSNLVRVTITPLREID